MDDAVAVFTIIGGVANVAMAMAAVVALTLWRKQIAGASHHDLAKRLSGALRQVSIARETALRDLRWALNIQLDGTADDTVDTTLTKLFGRHSLATSAPALEVAVKDLAALEGEVAVQWGDAVLEIVAVVRKASDSLVKFADACIVGKTSNSALLHGEPGIAPSYTQATYQKTLDALTRLAQDWLGAYVGREGADHMSTAELEARRKQIDDERARLAEGEKVSFVEESVAALSDEERARLTKLFAAREAAAMEGPQVSEPATATGERQGG